MTKGEVFDPFQEFLIVENTRLSHEQLSTDFNSIYWNIKFVLREDKCIPWFLKRYSKIILQTGRDLDAARTSLLTLSPISFSLQHDAIVLAHDRAAKQLLQVLRDKDIFTRFDFLKKFFLLEKGDFFSHFMDVAGADLRKQVGQTSTQLANRLGTLIQVAMKEREIFEPMLDELSCTLLPYAIDTHVEKIHSQEDAQDTFNEGTNTTCILLTQFDLINIWN